MTQDVHVAFAAAQTRSGGGFGRRKRHMNAVGVVVVLASAGLFALCGSTSRADDAPVVGPGPVTVDIGIEHSRFVPDVIRVREGTTVTFRVRNGDPIGHELIVGGRAVHERHETGAEAVHPPVPGEVSVPPQGTATTTYAVTFDDGDTVLFACHLPGHFAYGMRGELRRSA
jgi:uncharacterized cupredoxin-like copper-binding protein